MKNFDLEDEVPFGVDPETYVDDDGEHMNDMDADSCIQKIGNWERYRKFWLDYYAKRIDEVNEKCDRNIAWQKRHLRDFFMNVPHRKTKTLEAYDLPSGRISVTLSKPCLVPDKSAIIERFKSHGDNEFIKVKEELDWNGYKSRLFISDSGDVLDKETGEIIKDVAVEETETKFEVKPNKNGGNEDGRDEEV